MSTDDSAISAAKSPFDAYDVLGYFVPGACFLACVTAFEWLAAAHVCAAHCAPKTPLYSTVGALFLVNTSSSWLTDALIVGSLLLLAYVVGHVIASISAITIDRMYIAKGHGYPILQFLGRDKPSQDQLDGRDFYRGMMFWLNFYLVVRYLSPASAKPLRVLIPAPLENLLPTWNGDPIQTTALVLAIVLVAAIVCRGITKLFSTADSYRRAQLLQLSIANWALLAARTALRAFSWPSRVITRILGAASESTRLIDSLTQEKFVENLSKLLGAAWTGDGSSAFWNAFIFLRRSDPATVPALLNWLRLYSFARNIATAFYLAFLYGLIWWYSQGDLLGGTSVDERFALLVIPPLFLGIAFAMLQRFYYLYTDYFTKYLIRAFAFPPN